MLGVEEIFGGEEEGSNISEEGGVEKRGRERRKK